MGYFKTLNTKLWWHGINYTLIIAQLAVNLCDVVPHTGTTETISCIMARHHSNQLPEI